MTDTANLGLPSIAAAQAQKHVTHNEALKVLDALVMLSALDRTGTPPGAPDEGDRYLVTATATGAWAGWEDSIAAYQDGAWVRYQPGNGWRVLVLEDLTLYLFDSGAWAAKLDFNHAISLGGALTTAGALSVTGAHALTLALTAATSLTLPASGTLADIETGSWTPALTFATPGDLSVVYSTQTASYVKIGSLVWVRFAVACSTFTHSTASGALRITGLPYASDGSGRGAIEFQGITKAGYTQIAARVLGGQTYVDFRASGSGQTSASVSFSDVPSDGTVDIRGSVQYAAE
ncbi:MAG: DUF2793 domain-containing protein [Rhizobiales bacterium]|nr:DUF2793 domain-containing protein [Hyphomicrobiales bacterium]